MTSKSFKLAQIVAVAMFTCILVSPRIAQATPNPVALDPFLKDKLITITPISGDSVQPYLAIIKDGERVEYSGKQRYNNEQFQGMVFPVNTDTLSVGKVGSDEATGIDPKIFMRPLVIIGDDEVSRSWLSRFHQALTVRKAQVFVVNIASVESFKSLKSIAPNLYMHATNGDMLAEQLKLKHYPFYADRNGVLR